MRVENYMSSSPVTIRDDSVYWQAFDIMQEKDLHHVPVVDENKDVVGILALRDLQIAAQHFKEVPKDVAEVMHSPVVTISPGESLSDAARKMIDKRIGGLPVMDTDGKMVGILTETDLLRALINRLEDTPN